MAIPHIIALWCFLIWKVVSAVLKKCDLRANSMDAGAEAALREAVKGKVGFELLV